MIISEAFFGCIDKSRSSPKHLTDLNSRSRRRFALSLTTGFLVTASAWTDGTTFMPILSRFSLGMIGFLVTSSTKLKRRTWSFSVKCLEQTDEFSSGWLPLSSLLFHKSIHFFQRFLASGRSSFQNGIACNSKPFCTSRKAEHPPTTHLPGIFFTCYRKSRDKLANVS